MLDLKMIERTRGFREDYIKKLLSLNSLKLIERVYYVSWCGREEFTSCQDVVVAEKV